MFFDPAEPGVKLSILMHGSTTILVPKKMKLEEKGSARLAGISKLREVGWDEGEAKMNGMPLCMYLTILQLDELDTQMAKSGTERYSVHLLQAKEWCLAMYLKHS